MIRVLMIVRSTFYTDKGGDSVQVLQTAAGLRKKGVFADIKLTGEQLAYDQYDLLHFFNITRPADILCHVHRSGKPFVVSTIHLDYSEYDKYHRKGLTGAVLNLFGADGIEYIKTISRWVMGKDKLVTISYAWKGQRVCINEVLNKASLLLPNSESEFRRLKERYTFKTGHLVVPNGIDPALFVNNRTRPRDARLVLCVGRIEGRKNQLNLVHALRNTKYKLIIIGAAAPNQHAYYRACRELATPNIQFIEFLSQEELVKYYQEAAIHILPSWFETTGLSSLEAAAMGSNIVVTDKGDTREYFGDDAVYCDPASTESIYQAVEKAATLPHNETLGKKIYEHYTWEQATIRTIEAYEREKELWD